MEYNDYFPVAGAIWAGMPKTEKAPGQDLENKFRVVFEPGYEDLQEKFFSIYETFYPERLRAVFALPGIEQNYSIYNEGYNSGRMIARATDEKYLSVIDGLGKIYVLNGALRVPAMILQNGREIARLAPGDSLPWENGAHINLSDDGIRVINPVQKGEDTQIIYRGRNGQTAIGMQVNIRLNLFFPEFERCVSMQYRNRSFYNKLSIIASLGALRGYAAGINGGNFAGIPLVIYRRETDIVWNRPDGGATRRKAWVIQIEPDPESDWIKAANKKIISAAYGAGYVVPSPDFSAAPIDGDDPEYSDHAAGQGANTEEKPAESGSNSGSKSAENNTGQGQPNGSNQGSAPAVFRPYSKNDLVKKLTAAAVYHKSKIASDAQRTAVLAGLRMCCIESGLLADEIDKRVNFLLDVVSGNKNIKAVQDGVIIAIIEQWLKPEIDSHGHVSAIDTMAIREARGILAEMENRK